MLELSNSTILVVGGAGFVGSNLTRRLLQSDVRRIQVVDNFLSSEPSNLPSDPRLQVTHASITDDAVLKEMKDEYDFVFHLATYHGNQSSIHDPLADHENNTLTTLKLFERLKAFRHLKKVVYSSAGCSVATKTFDKAKPSEEVESVSLHQDSPYSLSKIFGEFYSVYYHKAHQLPTVRARFQNVYGPGEVLGAGKWRGTPATVWRNVVPVFIYKALKGEALPVENEGVATRDFIYVDDIVEGLITCALQGEAGNVYNLATSVETSILELATQINALTENPTPIEFRPKRDWDRSGKRFGSTAKSETELGFSAKIPIEEGLAITIDWTKRHLSEIEAMIEKHRAHL